MIVKVVESGGGLHSLELLELQGELTIPPELEVVKVEVKHQPGENSVTPSSEIVDGVAFGVLSETGKKCVLKIGTLVLEGDVQKLSKPYVVVKAFEQKNHITQEPERRKRPRDDGQREEGKDHLFSRERDCPHGSGERLADVGYEIYGIVTKRFLFRLKPTRSFSS